MNFLISSNWWLDLVNTVIGASIGSGVTIWAVYKTFKNERKKDENKNEQFQKEKLKYFKSLILTIEKALSEQIKFFKDYK